MSEQKQENKKEEETKSKDEIWADTGNGFQEAPLVAIKYGDAKLFEQLPGEGEKKVIEGWRYGRKMRSNTPYVWRVKANQTSGGGGSSATRIPQTLRRVEVRPASKINELLANNNKELWEYMDKMENAHDPTDPLIIVGKKERLFEVNIETAKEK